MQWRKFWYVKRTTRDIIIIYYIKSTKIIQYYQNIPYGFSFNNVLHIYNKFRDKDKNLFGYRHKPKKRLHACNYDNVYIRNLRIILHALFFCWRGVLRYRLAFYLELSLDIWIMLHVCHYSHKYIFFFTVKCIHDTSETLIGKSVNLREKI